MDGKAHQMHSQAPDVADPMCPMCQAPFKLRRPWQRFCSTECRNAFDVEFGAVGMVRGIRKVKQGVSVTILLEGPAQEKGLRLVLSELVRIVKNRP